MRPDDVHYVCMPMFHGNAVIADWAPALAAGAAVALRRRFSASGFLTDVRAYGATYFTYVGRAVQYLLATPPAPDDRDNPLRLGFGTEAGAVDAARFERAVRGAAGRGVRLLGGRRGDPADARTPRPARSAGRRRATTSRWSTRDTGEECPPAVLDAAGRLLNGDEAIGELVNRGPSPFEGYWRNPEAEAARPRGTAGTGPATSSTGTRTGFLYFAGRTDDRLRVDSENLAAAMIENILARYEGAAAVAVYAVPDPVAGRPGDGGGGPRDGRPSTPAPSPASWPRSRTWGRRWRPGSCGSCGGCRSRRPTRSTGRGSDARASAARTRCGGARRASGRTGD